MKIEELLKKEMNLTDAEKITDIALKATNIIPVIGPYSEIVLRFFIDPIQDRQKKYNMVVAEAIGELDKKFKILPDTLLSNEKFISCLYQATLIAIKNHQDEKLKMLKNALVSTVISNVQDDLNMHFFKMIDELNVTQFHILKWMSMNCEMIEKSDKLMDLYDIFKEDEIMIEPLVFRLYVYDLEKKGLITLGNISDYDEYSVTVVSWDNNSQKAELTPIGDQFLRFIIDSD